ncbi:MAG: phosphate signaling complex protein PhoU [Bacillota bacterium]|nr:phosphate signaling complex protein PhoU [Bacillota bacterium]
MVARIEFQNEMTLLHQSIIRMGATVENAINEAIEALVDLDADKAAIVVAQDDIVDNMEREIDHHCVEIIARQQPVASDLRDVTSTLKLITDLERIADHASDISERILALCAHENKVAVPHDVVTIAHMARNMLHGALDAYVMRDETLAESVIRMDEKIDERYENLKAYLVHLMKVDPANVDQLVEMLLICKYVERIADHAQNVAEWVVYYIQGRHRHD